MGGFGSGNHGGRPTVEDSLALDLAKLLRDRLIKPDCYSWGPLIWKNTRTGEQVAFINYEARLTDTSGCMRLMYTSTYYGSGEKHVSDYSINLVSRFRSSYSHLACRSSVRRQKRSTALRMSSADFVQRKGLGSALRTSM